MDKIDDLNLVQKAQSGDSKSFEQLVYRYKDYVYVLANRLLSNREEAEDLTQDVFIKVYHKLNTFKGGSKFSTWLYTITYREGLNRIKKMKIGTPVLQIDHLSINLNEEEENQNALVEMIQNESSNHLRKCIDLLNYNESTALMLFYYQELSLKEMIQVMEKSESSIKVILYRARKNLKKIFEENKEPLLFQK